MFKKPVNSIDWMGSIDSLLGTSCDFKFDESLDINLSNCLSIPPVQSSFIQVETLNNLKTPIGTHSKQNDLNNIPMAIPQYVHSNIVPITKESSNTLKIKRIIQYCCQNCKKIFTSKAEFENHYR